MILNAIYLLTDMQTALTDLNNDTESSVTLFLFLFLLFVAVVVFIALRYANRLKGLYIETRIDLKAQREQYLWERSTHWFSIQNALTQAYQNKQNKNKQVVSQIERHFVTLQALLSENEDKVDGLKQVQSVLDKIVEQVRALDNVLLEDISKTIGVARIQTANQVTDESASQQDLSVMAV